MTDTITLPRSVVEQALKALEKADRISGYRNNWAEVNSLIAALAQPKREQEPVAWIERWYGSGPERGWWIVCGRDHLAHLGPAEMSGEAASKIVSAHNTSPPAQRQPLTDGEILMVLDAAEIPELPRDFRDVDIDIARAIERAVWEKSNG